jgi:hypothetical protein
MERSFVGRLLEGLRLNRLLVVPETTSHSDCSRNDYSDSKENAHVRPPLIRVVPQYRVCASRAVAREQHAIAKMPRFTENSFEVSPTRSKGCGARGSLAFSVPAMNAPSNPAGAFLCFASPRVN